MPSPKSVVGWCLVAGGVLFEAVEHVDFINSHLPNQMTKIINEPLILVVVVVGFALVLIAGPRSQSEPTANEPDSVSAVPPAPPASRIEKRLRHNMQFTGAKYMRPTDNGPGIVLACFQNVPVPHTPLETFRAGRVTATFSHESGAAIGEISPEAWSDSDAPTVDFEAGVTHCTVVAAFIEGAWCGCRVESMDTYWGDAAFSVEHPPLPFGNIKVAIVLIGAMNVSLPPVDLTLTLTPDGSATIHNN